jgi:hypothetical protein
MVDDTLVIAGRFTGPRRAVIAVNPANGSATGFNANVADGEVGALARSGSRLYLGGTFTQVGGAKRIETAAVDVTSGAVDTGFRLDSQSAVTALTAAGPRLYAGARLGSFGSASRTLAAARLGTGSVSPDFDPAIDGAPAILALAATPTHLLVGTGFESMSPGTRPGLVAFPFLRPANASPPFITGTPRQDETLTCSPGSWKHDPASFALQWLRDGAPIGGAADSAYTLTAADARRLITCQVTAANDIGTGTAESAGVRPAALPPRFDTTPPRMTVVRTTIRSDAKGRVTIAVKCPTTEMTCSGVLRLESMVAADKRLGTFMGAVAVDLRGDQTGSLVIKLSKRFRGLLKARKKMKSTGTLRVRDAAGNASRLAVTLTLKAPKQKSTRR